MKPSMYSPQMPQQTYMPAAAAQTPFYPDTNMDPGHVSAGLPSQPVSAAAPSALAKGT